MGRSKEERHKEEKGKSRNRKRQETYKIVKIIIKYIFNTKG